MQVSSTSTEAFSEPDKPLFSLVMRYRNAPRRQPHLSSSSKKTNVPRSTNLSTAMILPPRPTANPQGSSSTRKEVRDKPKAAEERKKAELEGPGSTKPELKKELKTDSAGSEKVAVELQRRLLDNAVCSRLREPPTKEKIFDFWEHRGWSTWRTTFVRDSRIPQTCQLSSTAITVRGSLNDEYVSPHACLLNDLT